MFAVVLLASLAAGLALGQVFRVLVLLPTSGMLAGLVPAALTRQGVEPLPTAVVTIAALVCLQAGYLLGLAARALPHGSRPLGWASRLRPKALRIEPGSRADT